MNAFVGYHKETLSVAQLRELITQFATEPSYYFLRWTHQVSQDWKKPPTETDFPMIEGQMFNRQWELRWKLKRQDSYAVLLLSVVDREYPDFKKIGTDWQTQERDAHLYQSTETRFPKGFPSQQINIAQRYFIDAKTATVHFVALTVGN